MLVLLLVSVPPIVRLDPPPPNSMLGPSRLTVPLPVMLRLAPAVVATIAPVSRMKSPETLVRPVNALLLLVEPASATNDFAPSSNR